MIEIPHCGFLLRVPPHKIFGLDSHDPGYKEQVLLRGVACPACNADIWKWYGVTHTDFHEIDNLHHIREKNKNKWFQRSLTPRWVGAPGHRDFQRARFVGDFTNLISGDTAMVAEALLKRPLFKGDIPSLTNRKRIESEREKEQRRTAKPIVMVDKNR